VGERRKCSCVRQQAVGNADTLRPWWSEVELALLGTMLDGEVARRIGRTENAVRVKREKIEIATVKDRRRKGG
jgi:hypothetical protein